METFTSARSVGVLFNANNVDYYEPIHKFAGYLNRLGIKTRLWGVVDDKKIPDLYLMKSDIRIISQNDLSFFMEPSGHISDDFLDDTPDMLITVDFKNSFPVYYLSALSEAPFKVGSASKFDSCYDFLLKTDNPSPDFFLQSITDYLGKIKISKEFIAN